MANYKVVDADQLDADLTTVAEAIRVKTGETEKLSFPEGMASEMDAVFEAGKKSEYDAFWDFFQQKGTRTDYRYAFAYTPWDDTMFSPKYPLKFAGDASCAFLATIFTWVDKVLRVDLSEATILYWTFRNNQFSKLGKCDLSSAIDVRGAFSILPNLTEIEEIVSRADLPWSKTFQNDIGLESVTFSGVIGSNGLDFKDSYKLNKASITSIVNALSASTSGLTVTLSLTAVNNAFETSPGAADGSTSEEWLTLADTKSNWTIAVV